MKITHAFVDEITYIRAEFTRCAIVRVTVFFEIDEGLRRIPQADLQVPVRLDASMTQEQVAHEAQLRAVDMAAAMINMTLFEDGAPKLGSGGE